MRKLSKRFFTLAIALVMLLSCTAVAFADNVSNINGESILTSDAQLNETQMSIGAVFMPLATQSIRSGQTGGGDTNHPGIYTGTVTLTSSQYFTIVVGSYSKCIVDINGTSNSGQYYSKTLTIPATNGSAVKKTLTANNGKFPPGTYSYNVIFMNPNAAYAFELFLTDFNYN